MGRAFSNPVRVQSPQQGVDGRTTLGKARAPLITDGRIGDFFVDTMAKKLYGPKTAAGWPDNGLIKGDGGWSPVLGVTTDGVRRVYRVNDWQGGEGSKPSVGQYVGATGLVTNVADAIDIRGPVGPEMVIDGLVSASTDIADNTQMPSAQPANDNEKREVVEVFDLGGELPRRSIAHAQASTVRKAVASIRTRGYATRNDGGGAVYIRAAAEPAHDGKIRTADRWTADGNSDSINGGWWELAYDSPTPEMFGAKGGAVRGAANGGITSGTKVFASSTATFANADIGKAIVIQGAGAAGADLSTTITGVTNTTTVVVAATAGTTVSGANWCYGFDDADPIRKAIAFAKWIGGGEVNLRNQTYLTLSPLLLPSNVVTKGRGQGASVILHPSSHCWKNDAPTVGNTNVTLLDMTMDACGMSGGAVSMDGIKTLNCERLGVKGTRNRGITVGIGVAAIAGFESGDINVKGCTFDVADYGVVVSSTGGLGAIRGVIITGNSFKVGWGSGVSIAGNVKEGSVHGNRVVLAGTGPGGATGTGSDPVNDPNIGVGIKIWQGSSVTVCPESISVTGNTIVGVATKVDMQGVSVDNYTNNVTISGNVFDQLTNAVRNDFGATATGLIISGNTAKRCQYGVYNATSSDYRSVVTGNVFTDCVFGISGTFRSSPITGNRFANITEDAIVLLNPSRNASVAGNTADSVGKSFVRIPSSVANSSAVVISNNNIKDCGTLVTNTYDVLDLNDQAHVINGNVITNEATNKPRYIIGGTGSFRVVTSNYFFGAGTGYYRTAATGNDRFDNNVERGL